MGTGGLPGASEKVRHTIPNPPPPHPYPFFGLSKRNATSRISIWILENNIFHDLVVENEELVLSKNEPIRNY